MWTPHSASIRSCSAWRGAGEAAGFRRDETLLREVLRSSRSSVGARLLTKSLFSVHILSMQLCVMFWPREEDHLLAINGGELSLDTYFLRCVENADQKGR